MVREWFDPGCAAAGRLHSGLPVFAGQRARLLAWVRTGLALIAGGLATAQFLPEPRIPYLRERW